MTASFGAPWGEGKAQSKRSCGAPIPTWRWRTSGARASSVRSAERDRAAATDPAEREDSRQAIGTLLDSGALTPLGTRFVLEMRDSVSLLREPAARGRRIVRGAPPIPRLAAAAPLAGHGPVPSGEGTLW